MANRPDVTVEYTVKLPPGLKMMRDATSAPDGDGLIAVDGIGGGTCKPSLRVHSGRIWAIRSDYLAAMHAPPVRLDVNGADGFEAIRRRAEHRPAARAGAVVTIRVGGVLMPNPTELERFFFGAVSSFDLAAEIDALGRDPSVASIRLEVDSPGGDVRGIPELSEAVRRAAERKPVVAVASPTIASAALWMVAHATRIEVGPSGEIGSVGVIAEHVDLSGRREQLGIKSTLISDPEGKADGRQGFPLSDSARDRLAASVAMWSGRFIAALAAGRGVSEQHAREMFGRGDMLEATEALEAGLIDAIVDPIEAGGGRSRLSASSEFAGGLRSLAAEMRKQLEG